MLISGLLVTVREATSPEAVAQMLGGDPRLEVGQIIGEKIALVAEAADPEQAEALVNELLGREGVLFVDVVAVYFEEAIRGAA